MDFAEAQKRFNDLLQQRKNGTLSEQQWYPAVNDLRVTDSSGTVWQPSPDGNGWIFWNGSVWQPGTPPLPAGPPPAAADRDKAAPPVPASPPAAESGKTVTGPGTFRETARTVPWSLRPPGWWDIFSILGGVVLAVIWFIYAGIRGLSEGFDLLTPLILIGLPVALVLFRREFDDLLMPLQPARQRVPRLLLLGLGLAIPFLTAYILYEALSVDNYPLVQWNVLIGPLVSYAVMHDPVTGMASARTARPVSRSLKVPLLLFLFCTFCIRAVLADHCGGDIFNANDCLRSDGYAPGLAGGAGAFQAGNTSGGSFGRPPKRKPPRELPDFDRNAKPPAGKPGSDGVQKTADWYWGQAKNTAMDVVLDPIGGSQVVNAVDVFVDIAQTDNPGDAQRAAAGHFGDIAGNVPGVQNAVNVMTGDVGEWGD
jgi:hypothetical protein